MKKIQDRDGDWYEGNFDIKYETEKAILIDAGDKEVWLPLSQIEIRFEMGVGAIVSMPEWLAIDKELV